MTVPATGFGVAPAAGPDVARALLVHHSQAMGGRLDIHVAATPGEADAVHRETRRAAGRVRAWASILTRHDPGSPLMRLNDDPRAAVRVSPTLATAFAWACAAGEMTAGIVDVALLGARLGAESGRSGQATWSAADGDAGQTTTRRWSLQPGSRHRSAVVAREPGVRFDLDGIGKGWLADRALALLRRPGALVDADGDIAVRAAPADAWDVGVGDPRDDGAVLAVFRLPGGPHASRTYGIATSGTSVHRWGQGAATRHHLIDPRTGAPARTDVVQATVLAATAREAEALAKAVVILGAAGGLDLVERSAALGAVALLEDGRSVALPRTERYLA